MTVTVKIPTQLRTATEGEDSGVQVTSAFPVHPTVLAQVARAAAEASRAVSRAESMRRVRIVAGDFTEERGLLTPSLKIKRKAITREYERDIEALYS